VSQDAHVFALRALIDMGSQPEKPADLGERITRVLEAMGESETYAEHDRARQLLASAL
jgi:hypothetical protein